MLKNEYKRTVGALTGRTGTAGILGCMVGPCIGGFLFTVSSDKDLGYRYPFIFLFFCEIIFSILVAIFFYEIRITNVREKPLPRPEHYEQELDTLSRILALISITLNSLIVSSLDSTLAFRLRDAPYNYTPQIIGLMFTCSSLVYMATCIPVSYCIRKLPGDEDPINSSRVLKWFQAVGMLLFCVCFILLGPFSWGNIFNRWFDHSLFGWIAMFVKGIASGSFITVYPDLMIGVDEEDDVMQSKLSSLWNTAYVLGWSIGPFLGGILSEFYNFDGYANIITCIAGFYFLILLVSTLPCLETLLHPFDIGDNTNLVSYQSAGWLTFLQMESFYNYFRHKPKR